MKIFHLLKLAWSNFRFQVIVTTCALLLTGILEITSLFSLAPAVDVLLRPELDDVSPVTQSFVGFLKSVGLPVTIWVILGLFLVLNVLKSAMHLMGRCSVAWIQASAVRSMTVETSELLFGANWHVFAGERQGKMLNTLVRELSFTGLAFASLGTLISDCVLLTALTVVPFALSWQVTLVALVTGATLALPLLAVGKISYRLGKRTTSSANDMTATLQESLSAIRVIMGFGNQRQTIDTLSKTVNAYCRALLRSKAVSLAVPITYGPLGILTVMIALYSARLFQLPLSETAVLLYAMMKCIPFVSAILNSKTRLQSYYPSIEQVEEVQEKARNWPQKTGEREFRGFDGEIALTNISFTYPGSKDPVLNNVNMRIPKGLMIGLVGESGAGKSSLIDLIMGFNEAQEGSITVDGVSLYDFDIRSFRRRIGYVPQDSVLFNASVKDNLLWAKADATYAETREACVLANATEFIDDLPDGWDTVIGDRGIRLSGGQCQRLALSRAILRKPDLLILDEATSSLDSQSESLIQQSIEQLAQQTTVLVIAHRLSTIRKSDSIYVLEKGRIVENDSYDNLKANSGRFSEMIQLQFLKLQGRAES